MGDDDLTPAEVELVKHCSVGTVCNLSDRPDDQRRVRSWVLYELCVGTRWSVHAKGVQLGAATLDESLDFEFATLRVPLTLVGCNIVATLTLSNTTAPAILLLHCVIHEDLDADLLRVGYLSLRGPGLFA